MYQLHITSGATAVQSVELDKNVFTIGRLADNNIVLTDDSVSSRHARLERIEDSWQIIDLDSTNGTYLNQQELRPNSPTPWPAHVPLFIGSYTLLWHPVITTASVVSSSFPGHSESHQANLGSITLEPISFTLAPGSQQTVTVHAVNQAQHVEQYTLAVEGLPINWVKIAQTRVQLMPDLQKTTFQFQISIPTGTTAGTYPYRLVLRSVADQRVEGGAYGNVLVSPLPAFQATLKPAKVINKGNCQVVIHNRGNADAEYLVTGYSDSTAVQFDKSTQTVTVAAGREDRVVLGVSAAKRPLVGNTTDTQTFNVAVIPPAGEPQSPKATLEIRPHLTQRLLIFLTLLFGIPFALTVVSCRQQLTNATELAAIATGEAIAAIEEQSNVMATATSDASIRATRAWEISDSDGDGLTNEEEINLGTDPSNADMDQDGLLDGQELNASNVPLYRTSATNPDSDDDTLLDGDEVACNPNFDGPARGQCTDPGKKDSDDDGIPDNVDDDSSSWPLPTPLPDNNLLQNPSFELETEPFQTADGTIKYEINVPTFWNMLVDDNVENGVSGGSGSPFVFPEMQPWKKNQMNECITNPDEPICSIFSGELALKVFKGGLPIRFALYDQVPLEPGIYEFTIQYFADAVQFYYDQNRKVWAEEGSAQIQLCVDGGEYDHMDWESVAIGINNYATIKFVVPMARDVTIYAKFRNIQNLKNNGWFLDNWSLKKTGVYSDGMAISSSGDHGCRADMTQAHGN